MHAVNILGKTRHWCVCTGITLEELKVLHPALTGGQTLASKFH